MKKKTSKLSRKTCESCDLYDDCSIRSIDKSKCPYFREISKKQEPEHPHHIIPDDDEFMLKI